MTTVTALVADLQARGVILEHRADKLVVRPASKLTPGELEVLRHHKAAVLALLRPSRAGTAYYAFPWPDALPGLGPRRVVAFELCADCQAGGWVAYGGRSLCLRCARRRTEEPDPVRDGGPDDGGRPTLRVPGVSPNPHTRPPSAAPQEKGS